MNLEDFQYVQRLMRERVGLVLDDDKQYLVESRLIPVVRDLKLTGLDELIGNLRKQTFQGPHRQVVEAMLTTETLFFRDGQPFAGIRDGVLPDLLARRRTEEPIIFWSAACSSGQEPYSLAMLILEHFPQLVGRVRILATDLSREMLARCQAGKYTQMEVNRGLPASLLLKYFKKEGMDWILDRRVREMVDFRELNLTDPWREIPAPDVVFLRNVLIYFDIPTKQGILSRMARHMRPDGYLVLGGAETTFNLTDMFRRVQFGQAGFYQQRLPE